MPGMSAVSFIPNSHGPFHHHPCFFFGDSEIFFFIFYLDFLFRKTLWMVVSFTKPPNLKKEQKKMYGVFFSTALFPWENHDPGFP